MGYSYIKVRTVMGEHFMTLKNELSYSKSPSLT